MPPLENGDRLSRAEFERRYQAMSEIKRADLIEGVVYMASPLRFRPHAEPHANLLGWMWLYKISTPGVELGDTPTVRLDRDNEPQPDVVLRLDEARGGQSIIDSSGYISGAPELVAEISASTATIDLGDKLRAYRRNGVKEYIVWQVSDRRIDWFYLQNDEYVSLEPQQTGVLQSRVFPGLWLDRHAMVTGDMQRVMTVLQDGLSSNIHSACVAGLQAQSSESCAE
ncbi:MAG: Uma2 family endonuclease [Cyanobacteria bacterium P01_A01_bin.105]